MCGEVGRSRKGTVSGEKTGYVEGGSRPTQMGHQTTSGKR